MAENTQTRDGSNSNMQRQPEKSGTMNRGSNQTMQHEQAKASVSGQNREKSAIGSGEGGTQTGEPGRARSELDELGKSDKQGEFSNQR